ncbi:MAG: hypothetical protein HYX48_02275 [Chlamydiales bacterium]|nr:hypothetical protein [Chlamydiales bacterium]
MSMRAARTSCRRAQNFSRSSNSLGSPRGLGSPKGISKLALRTVTNSTSEPATPKSPKKLAVVSGAGATTARTPILKLMERGYNVVALTSNKENLSASVPGLEFVLVERNKMEDPDHFAKATQEGMKKLGVEKVSQCTALNLIGGAVAPKGSTLKKLNQDIPVAFFKGVKNIAERAAERLSLVHISSIAATVNGMGSDCEYARLKHETDERILLKKPEKGSVTVLRPGLVLPDPTPCGRVDMGHAYSPDQFWASRVVPVLGSGNQFQQPVSEHCLYDAALNGAERDGDFAKIINAVGSDVVTQKELFTLVGRDGRRWVIHIPYKFARCIAEHFPMGRIAPYSVNAFEVLDQMSQESQLLCAKDFEELLGRKPKGMREIYGQTLVGGPAPIAEHARLIVSKSFEDRRALLQLAKAFIRSIDSWKITRH